MIGVDLLIRHRRFLFLAVLYGVLLSLFYVGPAFNDDYGYINYALIWQRDAKIVADPLATRLPLLVALRVVFAMFGVGDAALRVMTLLFGLSSLCLVYLLGLRAFGRRAAEIGAGSFIVFPVVAQYMTEVVPEIPALILSGAAVLLLLRGGMRSGGHSTGAAWCYTGAGVVLGLAYLAKSTSALLLLLPCFEALHSLVRTRRVSGKALVCAAGFFAVWTAEALFYRLQNGDFLFHYHQELEYYTDSNFLKIGRCVDLWMYPRLMFLFAAWRGTYPFGLFMFVLVPAIVWALRKNGGEERIFAWWWLIVFLFHEFGSMSLSEYVTVDRQARYLVALAVPTVLLTSGFLVWLMECGRAFWGRFGRMLLLAQYVVGAVLSWHAMWFDLRGVRDIREIWKWAQTVPPERKVYMDAALIPRLIFLDGGKVLRKWEPFREGLSCGEVADSYLVFDSMSYVVGLTPYRRMLAPCLKDGTVASVISDPWQGESFSWYDPEIWYIAASAEG